MKNANLLSALTLLLLSLCCWQNASAQQVSLRQANTADYQWAGCTPLTGGYSTIGRGGNILQFVHFDAAKLVTLRKRYTIAGRTWEARDIQNAAAGVCPTGAAVPDGDFIAGNCNPTNAALPRKMFIMRTTLAGAVVWYRETDYAPGMGAKAAVPLANGNVVFIGQKAVNTVESICFDACGSPVWGPYIYKDFSNQFQINAEEAAFDPAFFRVVCTGYATNTAGVTRTLGFSINAFTGFLVWFNIYPDLLADKDRGYDIEFQAIPGTPPSLMMVGESVMAGAVGPNIYTVRILAATGAPMCAGRIRNAGPVPTTEFGRAINVSNNPGNWVIAGPIATTAATNDAFLMELDPCGNPLWARHYPLSVANANQMECIQLDPSTTATGSGYFVTTHTDVPTVSDYHDMWTLFDGRTPCCASTIFQPQQQPTQGFVQIVLDWNQITPWIPQQPVVGNFAAVRDECTQALAANGTNSNPVICPCPPSNISTLCVAPTGGTAPYSVLWSDGSTTACITVMPAATTTYSATVTDATGCTTVYKTTVTVLSCTAKPAGLTITNITQTTADINVTTTACYTSYQIRYRPVTTPVSPWTTITSATMPVTLTGLSNGKAYQVQVRALCCGTWTAWAAGTFTTLPFAPSADDRTSGQVLDNVEDVPNTEVYAWPNPASDLLTLEWETEGGIREILLFSADGRRLQTLAPGQKNMLQIDIRDLPAGLYFLRCSAENGETQTLRVGKN